MGKSGIEIIINIMENKALPVRSVREPEGEI